MEQTHDPEELQQSLDTAPARLDDLGGDLAAEVRETLRLLDLDAERLEQIAAALRGRPGKGGVGL